MCSKVLSCAIYVLFVSFSRCEDATEDEYKMPTVAVTILVRNKFHTLPYFLTCLYNQNYPKDRMYLWIHSDFNEDNSDEVLETWLESYASEYNGVHLTTNKSSGPLHPDEEVSTNWSPKHFEHVINLREEALDFARKLWADFIFMIDADVFLTNKDTLKILVDKNLPVVAPMLISDGLYSNFWCGMTENFYYERTEDYAPIQSRSRVGCFAVPMVHSCVLSSLRRASSDRLSFRPVPRYRGPRDDIIVFAVTATEHGIPMTVCNDHLYGYVPVPLEDGADPGHDREQLLNVKLEALGRHDPLPLQPALRPLVAYPEPWRFGLGRVYCINLRRRPERRALMEQSFLELGIDATFVDAVDGKDLDMDDIGSQGITFLPGYEDPYHKRRMKAGEVGCFLSHYNIWKEMVEQELAEALVLEDDVHFVPFFRHRLLALLEEIKDLDWDLVYIGRKILLDGSEQAVTAHTTRPLYSYWTLGYALRRAGAAKLLAARPLARLLPVDEFLPIMFDQHPNSTWKSHFPERNLKALSAAPLLVHPTHYTGQQGYISDTEDSALAAPRPRPRQEL